jgi:molybdopterin synthase catalytic subunit
MGHTITKNAVDKWRRRDSLPTESILAFAVLAKQRNQRFDLLDYVVEKEM